MNSKQLFFKLLHNARRLKGWDWMSRRAYLIGMLRMAYIIEGVVEDSLQFRVAHKDVLKDVGEWAECQGVGRFLFIPEAQLKE